jgi:hypothetical protein
MSSVQWFALLVHLAFLPVWLLSLGALAMTIFSPSSPVEPRKSFRRPSQEPLMTTLVVASHVALGISAMIFWPDIWFFMLLCGLVSLTATLLIELVAIDWWGAKFARFTAISVICFVMGFIWWDCFLKAFALLLPEGVRARQAHDHHVLAFVRLQELAM